MTDHPTPRQSFWQGVRDGGPFILIVGPFGLVFGVVATEAGLDVLQTMAFSIAVIAGAAQLTAIQLMTENAPTAIILITALAVNLRMAMYSASLTPHLGAAPVWQRALVAYLMVDQAYATSILRYEERPDWPVPVKVAYYFGVIALICPVWYLGTLAGAVLGNQIPEWIPLGAAVPIAFIALIGPMLRTLAHVAAALTSVVGALVLAFLPYNLGLLIAALAAMAVGAAVEVWLVRTNRWVKP
ncbi:AzlC family ABC transporter permease [Pararhodobacter sp. CCB-MM2]|uniref:AzlC family ABC transporter permease n=1 Tax=Pararhodobacter sp. CCB-MM2 TaxID=1786003 RepID=UPI0008331B98|nr:AzlC family ABC transporter permease [Pararhodobacter sp. CCB-MM2]MCA2012608.1 AzlC family ABC transporter permease [Cereibacter sphaeroides]